MSKIIDLTGKKFGHWTVIERAANNAKGGARWLCECDCDAHTRKIVDGYSLRSGKSQSCGCLQKQKISNINFIDITGQKFGHLTVKKYIGSDNSRKSLWECECDCDAHTIIITRGTDLRSGKTTSCGCIKSKGEDKIATLLTQNNIPFIKEKTFNTCRFPDTNALAKFDFYVDNKYLIEFDGIQHFNEKNPWFDDDRTLKDKYKTQWCLENNIPLIRIHYSQLKNLKLEDIIL